MALDIARSQMSSNIRNVKSANYKCYMNKNSMLPFYEYSKLSFNKHTNFKTSSQKRPKPYFKSIHKKLSRIMFFYAVQMEQTRGSDLSPGQND